MFLFPTSFRHPNTLVISHCENIQEEALHVEIDRTHDNQNHRFSLEHAHITGCGKCLTTYSSHAQLFGQEHSVAVSK